MGQRTFYECDLEGCDTEAESMTGFAEVRTKEPRLTPLVSKTGTTDVVRIICPKCVALMIFKPGSGA